MHKVLPTLQYCLTDLARIEVGGYVGRENTTMCRPSLFSMRMCGVMKTELEKVEIHDLWLVACFLFPFLRDMEFWENATERESFKTRAESLTRSLYPSGAMDLDSIPSHDNGRGLTHGSEDGVPTNSMCTQASSSLSMLGKRKFSLRDHISRAEFSEEDQDEVNRYKHTPLRQMGLDQDTFLSDPFSVVRFWHSRKRSYPQLSKIAMRIFATPASSCASERVFSIVNKLVTSDRSVLSTKLISQIIVSRSLRRYDD